MDLILADGNLTTAAVLDVLLELFEMSDAVVGYTEGADLARLLGFDESTPRAKTSLLTTVRSVDQDAVRVREQFLAICLFVTKVALVKRARRRDVQINVVEFRLLETRRDSRLGLFIPKLGPGDLGGVEDLGAVKARLSDGLCGFCFVLVDFCGVDLVLRWQVLVGAGYFL